MTSMYNDDMMDETEMQLEELDQHPEATQLDILTYEVEHLQEHGIQPTYEWYEARFVKIYQYSELNWRELHTKYYHLNQTMSEQAERIAGGLHHLVEEWGSSPIFDLAIYYGVLHDMQALWKHYEAEYTDENQDDDVSDLISSMKHL